MTATTFYERHKNQLWYITLRQFLRHKMAVAGMLIMAVMLLSVVFVDQLSPYDAEKPDLSNMLASPSLQHPLGTNELGRDLLTRTLYGGRISLVVGVFVNDAQHFYNAIYIKFILIDLFNHFKIILLLF